MDEKVNIDILKRKAKVYDLMVILNGAQQEITRLNNEILVLQKKVKEKK